MANTYTTKGGEQWDEIARTVYGAEKHADWLMRHNFPLLDIYEFDTGTVLQTPPLPADTSEKLPDWRQVWAR